MENFICVLNVTRTVGDQDGPELRKESIVKMFYFTGSYIGLQYDRVCIACFLNVHIYNKCTFVQTCLKFKWQNDIEFVLNVHVFKANITIILSLQQYKPCITLTR